MASAREVRKRIRSVKNIGQITRALEAVSASRVRKSQARVLASRAYAEKAWEILLNIQKSAAKGTPLHPLLTPRTTINRTLIVLVTSDRGLAGAYNANVIRAARRFRSRIKNETSFVAVGRKGRDSLIRARENVIAEFPNPAETNISELRPITRLIIDSFLDGEFDEVFVAYTDFINTLAQKPTVLRLLPLIPYETEDQVAAEYVKDMPQISSGSLDYEYEPNAAGILDEIVPRFTVLQLYQSILEAQASEHSSRMVAMRNASENAGGFVEDLTLVYNKARQSGITAEILDIVGGAEALQNSIDKAADAVLAAYHLEAGGPPRSQRITLSSRNVEVNPTVDAPERPLSVGLYPAIEEVIELIAEVPHPAQDDAPEAVQVDEAYDDAPEAAHVDEPHDDAPEASQVDQAHADAPEAAEPESPKMDNLLVIEGIGPKMSAALIAAGITTYAQLSESSEETLRAAIESAGMRFSPTLPTWAAQASYAARGDWDGLAAYQDSLSAGRDS